MKPWMMSFHLQCVTSSHRHYCLDASASQCNYTAQACLVKCRGFPRMPATMHWLAWMEPLIALGSRFDIPFPIIVPDEFDESFLFLY